MKRDGKFGATLFTPHPALGPGGACVDGTRRASVFPSSLTIRGIRPSVTLDAAPRPDFS
jgi:hypothetical protein